VTAERVAAVIVCKTPLGGQSKTRLSPPLLPEQCAEISACFIRDLAANIQHLVDEGAVAGAALYTPFGTEAQLQRLLPGGFELVLQGEGDLGARLLKGCEDLLRKGYRGVILINSDSPTLPLSILRDTVAALRSGSRIVLGPATDGGYILIGLSAAYPRLFQDIPWSTPAVCDLTMRRAAEIDVPVTTVDAWYDVDDKASLETLAAEMRGERPAFAPRSLIAAEAPATRAYLRQIEVLAPGAA
jgi:rSAM/selenodomain-associated transferase 1